MLTTVIIGFLAIVIVLKIFQGMLRLFLIIVTLMLVLGGSLIMKEQIPYSIEL